MGLGTNLMKQTAVYWAPESGTFDEFGRPVRVGPVQVVCRWEDVAEEFIDATGNRAVSRSKVLLASDVKQAGYLLLGDLEDVRVDADNTLTPLATADDGSGSYELWSTSALSILWQDVLNPKEAYISFPSTILPGSIIDSAVLWLTRSREAAVNTTIRISVLAHWTDLVVKPAVGTVVIATGTELFEHGQLGSTASFDITDLVQAVVDHSGFTNPGRICVKLEATVFADPERSVVSFEGAQESGHTEDEMPTLEVLSHSYHTDPKEVGAFEIRSFSKTPTFKATSFIRQAYL